MVQLSCINGIKDVNFISNTVEIGISRIWYMKMKKLSDLILITHKKLTIKLVSFYF